MSGEHEPEYGGAKTQITSEEVAALIELASDHVEEERRQSLQECLNSFGDPDKNEIENVVVLADKFMNEVGLTEALDRLYVFSEIIAERCQEHPSVVMCREAYWKVRLAANLLSEAYQDVAKGLPEMREQVIAAVNDQKAREQRAERLMQQVEGILQDASTPMSPREAIHQKMQEMQGEQNEAGE